MPANNSEEFILNTEFSASLRAFGLHLAWLQRILLGSIMAICFFPVAFGQFSGCHSKTEILSRNEQMIPGASR